MSSPENLRYALDEPVEGQTFEFQEVIIRGWAVAEDGAATVHVNIANQAWVPVSSANFRNDVAQALPEYPDAARSAFNGRIDTHALPPGEYPVRILFTFATGAKQELQRTVQLLPTPTYANQVSVTKDDDTVRMKLEEPSTKSLVLRNSVLRVGGWAASIKGVEKVDLWLDGNGPHAAHYGLMRDDIGSLYSEFVQSSHAGFLWAGSIPHLTPGRHELRLRCLSKSGVVAELTSTFVVEERTEYDIWAKLNQLSADELLVLSEDGLQLPYKPKISIVTPVYRTPLAYLQKCVDSVRNQAYANWELVLVDDGSHDSLLTFHLNEIAVSDRRIRVVTSDANGGIAAASNVGLQLCRGEFIGLLDHDDELAPDACLRVVQELNRDPTLDVFYSDEDKLNEEGKQQEPFFKPDWSPDLLLSMNYVAHFLVCRRTVFQAIGGFQLGYDGSQDYDLILRISEVTQKIRRIPRVLYHWRIHQLSTAANMAVKPAASDAGRRALQDHLQRTAINGCATEIGPGRYRIRYQLDGEPEIAIVIPSGGSPTLAAALQSVLETTTYKNYSLIVVDNSKGERVVETVARFQSAQRPIQLIDCRGLPFNFSLLCNRAAASTRSEYLLFLNDDTTIITPDWLQTMLEQAQQPRTGVVGALLLFPNGGIQHAGVATGLFGVAGHPFRGFEEKHYYFDFTHVVRNCAAVTGACLLMRRDVFDEVQGFDEPNLPTCFQDVDICLKALEHGYRVVYTPFAKLYHHESFSKKAISEMPEIEFMKTHWKDYLADDPFYNPNLTTATDDYSLKYDPMFLTRHQDADVVDSFHSNGRQPSTKQTAVARRASALAPIQFQVRREKIGADGQSARLTFTWKTAGIEKVNIRVSSPTGCLLAEGESQGTLTTNQWIDKGTVFYLLDASETEIGSPDQVLSALKA